MFENKFGGDVKSMATLMLPCLVPRRTYRNMEDERKGQEGNDESSLLYQGGHYSQDSLCFCSL